MGRWSHLQSTLVLANLQELHHTALIWCPASNLTNNGPDLQGHGYVLISVARVPVDMDKHCRMHSNSSSAHICLLCGQN